MNQQTSQRGFTRVVIKIGSSSLVNSDGLLDTEKVTFYSRALAEIHPRTETILVSSGAVAAGRPVLKLSGAPTTTNLKQAAAAIGQVALMNAYEQVLATFGISTGQLLLTKRDLAFRPSYRNALDTLETLLSYKILPVINENDSVKLPENTFGDNDMLAALVSALVHADHLIILTDTNGIFSANPHTDPRAKRFDTLASITDEVRAAAGSKGSSVGTGGMRTKVKAAFTANSLGVPVFIGKIHSPTGLIDILSGKGDGTYIGNSEQLHTGRKAQWIAFHSKVAGNIVIDDGAVKALHEQGRSLLPAGVLSLTGQFQSGDVVSLSDTKDTFIGKGIVEYDSKQLLAALGKSTDFVQTHLSVKRTEVIHRDNLVKIDARED